MSSPETATAPPDVLCCGELAAGSLAALFARFSLAVVEVPLGAVIPGSYWGDCEAGVVGRNVYVRPDTPVHSALHEGGHLICALAAGREPFDTEAGSDHAEESAVCYLQVQLADLLPGVGRDRLIADMDAWGYSFRLGSTRAWFENDAEDAAAWLAAHGLGQLAAG